MLGLTCNACNKEFRDNADQKLHYKSDWHRYNLKRKVAGVPGVTEALFMARQAALVQDKDKSAEVVPMTYTCGLCGKGYRSAKAHAQHLGSRGHVVRASQLAPGEEGGGVVIKPFQRRAVERRQLDEEAEESGDEWEEVESEDEDMVAGLEGDEEDMDEDGEDHPLDPSSCFMCDQEHPDIESCIVHMHKYHGFFIPDVEYLKDPSGLLTYLGLMVKRDFMCLYCNDRCHPFSSLEAVRKHMEAKSHCKVHYGDGTEDEEAELEDFYDYSSSYVDEAGKQLVASGDTANTVELGSAGSELVITNRSTSKTSTKTLGSREFLRYYRQKPRPSADDMAIITALASRYKSMGLATVQSKEQFVRMKVLKKINRSGVEAMRNKIGMKSNVIRNLPNNVPY